VVAATVERHRQRAPGVARRGSGGTRACCSASASATRSASASAHHCLEGKQTRIGQPDVRGGNRRLQAERALEGVARPVTASDERFECGASAMKARYGSAATTRRAAGT
jgi:hypothetical protein